MKCPHGNKHCDGDLIICDDCTLDIVAKAFNDVIEKGKKIGE